MFFASTFPQFLQTSFIQQRGADENLDLTSQEVVQVYSYEDRIRVVELYIKYDLSAADTIRELGFPSYKMLVRCYREYQETGQLHETRNKGLYRLYTQQQMEAAVNYYLEHGRNISRTVRAVGYPSRETLRVWVDQLAPGEGKPRVKRSGVVQFSQEQKHDAVVELCTREGSAADVANRLGVSRCILYKWRRELLGGDANMNEPSKPILLDDKDVLLAKVESLNKQIYRQQMELDILKKSFEGLCRRNSLSYHIRKNAGIAHTKER